jgi:cell division protein FtsB
MSTRQRKQSKLKPLLIPAACLLILGYFAFHSVEGDFGLLALQKLKDREAGLLAELDKLTREKNRMEKRVALMRPESLDPDMIDEKARESLNMAHRDDRVILLPAIR